MNSNKINSKFRFRKNVDIGSLEAENDTFLKSCFVEKSELDVLRDINSRKCILIGRTGSGKSALLKHIEDTEQSVVRIIPEAMSLKYLSNSTVLRYFDGQNINLDLFYKVIWKHVFIVELLKMMFGNKEATKNKLQSLLDKFTSNKGKQKAIEYLKSWQDQFWEKAEYRIKEMERQLESKLEDVFGMKFCDILNASSSENTTEKISQKYEVIQKAQSVVNELQVKELYEIIEIVKDELLKKGNKEYFIIIDDLDKNWVEDRLVYDLLKGLILAINDLSALHNFKIIISLRSNLFDMILAKSKTKGIQREKFDSLFLNISWSEAELKELLEKRLAQLFKHSYTSESPSIEDILPKAHKSTKSGIEHMLERTMMRPRDLIAFFNEGINVADNKTNFSRENIREAEANYSLKRLNALEDEWRDNYGDLMPIFELFRNCNYPFRVSELTDESIISSRVWSKDFSFKEPLNSMIISLNNVLDTHKFYLQLLPLLYKIGFLGIKLSAQHKMSYSFDTSIQITESDIDITTPCYIHPMFHSALKIKKESD